jgi:hypothetical protein
VGDEQLNGRHIESKLGIDVMTILECSWEKRDRYNLWITDERAEEAEVTGNRVYG